MPLISIIVPCYNQAEYLDECLQSVLDQTYADWECIIINDGSPDKTEEVAKTWLEKDNRFKYFFKENGGLSSARNAGIKIAKGEWILPLDADDKIGNEYLTFAKNEFNNKVGIIYSKAAFFGIKEKLWNLSDYNPSQIFLENQIYCAAFFKKEDWQNICGYDENLKHGREDWEFWINLLSKTNKVVVRIDYLGFYYRRKNESMDIFINENHPAMFETELYIYNKHINLYKNLGSPIQNLNKIKSLENIEEKHKKLLTVIRKNILTKFLFTIIEKI